MNKIAQALVLTTVFLIVSAMAGSLLACPNCKAAVAENNDHLSAGFAWSIALLLAVPASLLTGWVIALKRLFAA